MTQTSTPTRRIFGRGSYSEVLRIQEILRRDTVGGFLLVGAATVALLWANSPWSDGYFGLRDTRLGYEPWHLNLTVGEWAADGLLAIFFFLVGLELKREFVAGDLRSPAKALVPIAAAFGGVIAPAIIYAIINLQSGDTLRGWAIPTATDIAFAVAVLVVLAPRLPTALRLFLLTLAVADDLIAITIIAIFYTSNLNLAALVAAAVPLACFAILAQRNPDFFCRRSVAAWTILLPVGVVMWALMHASGVHPTVAGVLLGFTVPVLRGGTNGMAPTMEHRFGPLSAGVAVPVFAFFAAGVAIGGSEQIGTAITDPVTMGIVTGLVLGKPIGIMLTTWVLTKFTRAQLDKAVRWIDVFGVSLLAGIGFTVSLLVAELSFDHGSLHNDHAKIGILCASLLATLLAAIVLVPRNRRFRAIAAAEAVDADQDGIPDVYQRDAGTTTAP